jgi:hypothetical protein
LLAELLDFLNSGFLLSSVHGTGKVRGVHSFNDPAGDSNSSPGDNGVVSSGGFDKGEHVCLKYKINKIIINYKMKTNYNTKDYRSVA